MQNTSQQERDGNTLKKHEVGVLSSANVSNSPLLVTENVRRCDQPRHTTARSLRSPRHSVAGVGPEHMTLPGPSSAASERVNTLGAALPSR